jgi:HAD superfamily hydrolase (TIGR01509 family)
MSSALPAAVLWDMDGTLVDTEPYWMEAETALVESFGGTWTHEQALTLVGQGLETSGAILQEAGVRMSGRRHRSPHRRGDAPAGRAGPLRPGAHELLAALRGAGIRCALVTMSMRRMAEQVVAPFPELFEIIVAGDDVTRPKPFPDAYLQACGALGVDPADASRSRTRRRACAPPSPPGSRRSACR